MNVDKLVSFLDDFSTARPWLEQLGLNAPTTAHANLVGIAEDGVTLDLLSDICGQLAEHLPQLPDPDSVLESLARFVRASRSPLSFGSLVGQDHEALPVLLQLFSVSTALSETLIRDPAAYDLLRITEGREVERQALTAEIWGEVKNLTDMRDVAISLGNFRRRETLRITYGDLISQHPVEVVTAQLAFLADAICATALDSARQHLQRQRGVPLGDDGRPARFALVGLDRLGGNELDYGSYIRGLFLFDGHGSTDAAKPVENEDFFDRLVKLTIDTLRGEEESGAGYQLDIDGSPAGQKGKRCLTFDETKAHFETRGRTWERQSLIKARTVAGDSTLGDDFVQALQPWTYRTYLNRADMTGINALKRRLERRAERNVNHSMNVEHDVTNIESVVQFVQLITGGGSPGVRVGNSLLAMTQLAKAESLTESEATELQTIYRWLRIVEHRLEIMRPGSAGKIPSDTAALARLARWCGYANDSEIMSPTTSLRSAYYEYAERACVLTNQLLEKTNSDEVEQEDERDLVLDPAPTRQFIEDTLRPYRFADAHAIHLSLCELANEQIPFLSTRRCRHFLSLIARRLLKAVAATPSPSATLTNLCRVSDSLGGKGVLWELFSFHAPSLDLYVRLCSSSPYLTAILTRYPGMIDELLDSLLLAQLPPLGELQQTLDDLCGNNEDNLSPVLHSFKNTQHLNVGVRELLGHADIRETTATLADVAEACLQRIVHQQHNRLVSKYGAPTVGGSDRSCEPILLAMGKLGGREPNYHSDADIIFLYEADGNTRVPPGGREPTSNQHFYSELCQRTIRAISDHGVNGKLYDSNARLRPTGPSGPVAASLEVFRDHYLQDARTFEEIRALCQARPIHGPERLRSKTAATLREILTHHGDRFDPQEIWDARLNIQASAGMENLKRGPGGLTDVDFIVQVLQLRNAKGGSALFRPNTFAALDTLERAGLLSAGHGAHLRSAYRFLREVEACLRLMNTTARHNIPADPEELAKLAYLLRYSGPISLTAECERVMKENRSCLHRIVDQG